MVGTQFHIPFLLQTPASSEAAAPPSDTGANGHHILGDVYLVGPDLLQRLDELEGVPHFYTREIETIKIIDHGGVQGGGQDAEAPPLPEQLPCYVYIKSEWWVLFCRQSFPSARRPPADTLGSKSPLP